MIATIATIAEKKTKFQRSQRSKRSLCFFTAAHFNLVAASIFQTFLPPLFLFSCFSSNKICHRCYLFLALALSPLSKLMSTLKCNEKKESFVAVFIFSLNVRAAMWFTSETSGVLEMQNFTSAIILPGRADSWLPSPSPSVCTYVRVYADVIIKFSRMDRWPFFLSYGAPLARTSLHYKITNWTA